MSAHLPRLGPCSCRRGIERDNCPQCEGTGQRIDFRAIRAAHPVVWIIRSETADPEDGFLYWSNVDGWTYRDAADVYTEQEAARVTLPIGGRWTTEWGSK